MNREEFVKHGKPKGVEYYAVHNLLDHWKNDNNIPDNVQCVVHHRDDTEECINYNAEHYELYGFNEDGTFEYGKYVVFMTNAEHNTYHHKGKIISDATREKLSLANGGEKNGFYGKSHTEESKQKIREARTGRKHSEETKQKLREASTNRKHSEETKQKLRELRSQQMKDDSLHYHLYKANGGELSWYVFRKQFHNNDPQIMRYFNKKLLI